MSKSRLTPIEAHILAQLGGRRWTRKRFNKAIVKAAQAEWKAVHTAVGFAKGAIMTTEKTSPKLGKSGVPSLGMTIHSAQNALIAWNAIDPGTQTGLAAAVGATTEEISRVLRYSVCPKSSRGCRCGCVTAESFHARMERSQVARLARHLFLLFRPASAFALMGSELRDAEFEHGPRGARWRVNVSDDLRIELLAPGLFEVAPRAYSYTKWAPEERPGRAGFRLVYSASEHTSDEQIKAWCEAGHRVAVVLDVPRSQSLPATRDGITVVDGDETDDLWAHPEGVIVGLRAKGTAEVKGKMLEYGFTKPAVASTPVQLLGVGRPAPFPVATTGCPSSCPIAAAA